MDPAENGGVRAYLDNVSDDFGPDPKSFER
jgi:hypothetical protein